MIKSARKSGLLLPVCDALFVENLLHPDLEDLPSAFFIEISSGDFFSPDNG
jgi:hypothetical protein